MLYNVIYSIFGGMGLHYSERIYYDDPIKNEEFIRVYGSTLYCKHGISLAYQKCWRCKEEAETQRFKKHMDSKYRNFNPFAEFFYGQKYPTDDDKPTDMDDDFKVMGLSRSSSEEDLKKAYRKSAIKTHPDKVGGDGSAFKRMKQAYDNIKRRFL
tara:strand:+ start:1232 stop:1696 length:465 start_codon:yes stop_codon:yes gene_type:complete